MVDMSGYVKTLTDLTDEEKIKSVSFYKKKNYVNSLGEKLISLTGQKVEMGYGNINSKIVFIFKNKSRVKRIKKRIEKIMEGADSIFSDVYVTFLDKTEKIIYDKYAYMSAELSAIKPVIIYYISDNDNDLSEDNDFNSLKKNVNETVKINPVFYYITETELMSEDIQIRRNLWQKFRFIINYKERI